MRLEPQHEQRRARPATYALLSTGGQVAIDWQLFIAVGEQAVRLSRPFYAKPADDDGRKLSLEPQHAELSADGGGAGDGSGADAAAGEGGDAVVREGLELIVGAPSPAQPRHGPSWPSSSPQPGSRAAPVTPSRPPEGAEGAEGAEEAPALVGTAHAPPPVKCYVELLTLHPVVLNYTSSSGVGFANMQKLGASLHTGTLQFLGGYVLAMLNALGVMCAAPPPRPRAVPTPPPATFPPLTSTPRAHAHSHHRRSDWLSRRACAQAQADLGGQRAAPAQRPGAAAPVRAVRPAAQPHRPPLHLPGVAGAAEGGGRFGPARLARRGTPRRDDLAPRTRRCGARGAYHSHAPGPLSGPQVLGNLGTGVWDFFYEPATALMRTPRALHLAVAKGTMSLVRNTVMGTAQATSRVSDTLSKGLAAISMDDDYIRRRAARMAAHRPQTIREGLMGGARNLGHSVAEGASGLITSPISGARRDGVKGALVGVASGIVGVAVKPVAQLVERHAALCPVGAQRPTRPPGCLRGLRPLLRTPERRLSSNLDA